MIHLHQVRYGFIIGIMILAFASIPGVQGQDCSSGEIAHTIQRGENLFRISLRYGVSQSAIAIRNRIVNPARIIAGETICIPKGGVDNGTSSTAASSTSRSTTDSDNSGVTNSIVIINDGGNWCNPGGPWAGKCDITDDLALRNLLWRCGWYFARGLTSAECGIPPGAGTGPRDIEVDVLTTLDSETVIPLTYFADTESCTVDIVTDGGALPEDWSLSEEFAFAVLSLQDAGCSSFRATSSGAVLLQGDL